jgi:secondary thiamine-phosphate synthase enzyme
VIVTKKISLETRGDGDTQDITAEVARLVGGSGVKSGVVTLFCPGSTSALTTIEFESGVIADLQQVFEETAPKERYYRHNERWHDGNGHSHVRASLMGPSLTVPFVSGVLTLGTWQQIVHIDFDVRPRRREVIVQIVGE